MATFSKLSRWPVGYFRAFSSWLLRNRREVALNIETLTSEIERIGFITIVYRAVDNEDGSRTVTEDRMGFSVTPNTSLERLLQAYIAQGGNPLDISPFWHPDETAVVSYNGNEEPVLAPSYPHGGIVYLKSASPEEPYAKTRVDDDGNTIFETTGYEHFPGGDPNTDRFYSARLGQRFTRSDLNITTLMRKMRGWSNQAIKERLQDLEWRIIKLMDLREQLSHERDDVLQQAFGGALAGTPGFDEERFNPGLSVQSLVQEMYSLLYEKDDSGSVQGFRVKEEVAFLDFTFKDAVSEYRFPLGC